MAAGGERQSARYLLLLAAALAAVACLYAVLSPGTYQDDDLDRYYMAREVWRQPVLLLDAWGMPLALLLLALPARLFGYAGVEAMSALATAGAAYAAARAARSLGLGNAWLAALFVFFQPIVLTLSFGGLAEPVAALVLGLVLWAWYGGHRTRAVLLAGLLPLARIETGALTLLVLAAGWRSVGWKARIGAILPVLVWNGLGALLSGDLLHALGGGGTRPLSSLGPLHYLRYANVIVGPVVLFFVLWGLVAWGFPAPRREPGERGTGFPALATALWVLHLGLLSLLAWEALPFGRSIGFLRHLAASSPALALTALWGFRDWSASGAGRPRLPRVLLVLLWTGLVAWLLSGELIGHSFAGPGRVPMRWIVTAALGGLGLLALWRPLPGKRAVAPAVGLFTVLWALVAVRPIDLDPERQAVQRVVEYLELGGNGDAVVYTNHPWFVFLSGRDRYDLRRTPHLTRDALARAPAGSFVFWENHYGPRLWGDVPLDELRGNPRLTRLFEATAGVGENFRVVLFGVTGPPVSGSGSGE